MALASAAFVNHTCDPNCETDQIDNRIWIMALRNIEPGEELMYDYNLFDGDIGEKAPCYCGLRCRQTMFSEEEVVRQKKVLRQRKKRREAARLRREKERRAATRRR